MNGVCPPEFAKGVEERRGGENRNDKGTTTTKNISLEYLIPSKDKETMTGIRGDCVNEGVWPTARDHYGHPHSTTREELVLSVQIAALPIAFLEHVSTPNLTTIIFLVE